MSQHLRHLISLLVVLLACYARGDIRLAALFSDHMVLQQGQSVPVWGWAEPGESVTVEFRDQKQTVTAGPEGKWKLKLSRLKAGGPDPLKVSGRNQITVSDVLVGEVWVASGQSNMEWPLRLVHEPEKAIAEANFPNIRLFTVPKLKADAPVGDVKASWNVCSSQTVSNFSGVAYYFGRDLHKALGVPVGLIQTSWGGSPAEVWMRQEILDGNARYKKEIMESYQRSLKQYEEALAKFQAQEAELKAEGKSSTQKPPTKHWKPTELYNGMIAPIIPYAMKGAIWYQGESNAGRAHQYRSLYTDMIRNWREDWGQGDFTFLAVQLAPFMKIKEEPSESAWAELREAQWLATTTLPKVGLAVITDVGDEKDIHPRKKEPVGARLALAARGIAYGEPVEYSGPVFKSMRVRNGRAVLTFDHVGSGLEVRGDELAGFTMAGPDKKFVCAKATVRKNRVVVSHPDITEPAAVRFGWADFPVVNLWNSAGLPAVPFRTDDYPMTTAPKE